MIYTEILTHVIWKRQFIGLRFFDALHVKAKGVSEVTTGELSLYMHLPVTRVWVRVIVRSALFTKHSELPDIPNYPGLPYIAKVTLSMNSLYRKPILHIPFREDQQTCVISTRLSPVSQPPSQS